MRIRLLILLTLILSFVARGEDFAADFPPRFTYEETYHDTIVEDPEFDDYLVVPKATLKMTFVGSTNGVDLTLINEQIVVSIEFGAFVNSWSLSQDAAYRKGKTSATFLLEGTDPISGDPLEPGEAGKVTVVWDNKKVTIAVSAKGSPDDYPVLAQERASLGPPMSSYATSLPVSVGFGNWQLSGRTVYIAGSAAFEESERDDNTETLAHVDLSGAIDSNPPVVTILAPAADAEVSDPAYRITGTALDDRGIATVLVKQSGIL